MPILTVLISLLLIALGVGFKLGTGTQSMTALMPAFLGLPILLCGLIAFSPKARKHAMHAAMVFALLGIIGTAIPLITRSPSGAALVSQLLTVALCALLVIAGVRSFIAARKQRGSEPAAE
jgi:uncharacterized membrane protein